MSLMEVVSPGVERRVRVERIFREPVRGFQRISPERAEQVRGSLRKQPDAREGVSKGRTASSEEDRGYDWYQVLVWEKQGRRSSPA